MGLQTLSGLRHQGFFIPYRYADSIAPRQPVYESLAGLFAAAEPVFEDLLRGAEGYAADLLRIAAERAPPPAPRFDQSWFPTLDAVAAYTLVRQYGPRRIVEVGSGHSTRFLARAVRDGGLPTEITAIDPAPRADLRGLPIRLVQTVVQQAGMAPFQALREGDILFIDSSHILMPGTDVDWLFNRILPGLPEGILIHIHDIFLPDDYPPAWAWRGYNEQQGVGPLLSCGFKPIFASHFVATRLSAQLHTGVIGRLPGAAEAIPASLWLCKGT
ncbi:MAG TPA: class I SAM-dependent methyltransferase [Ferrovibrio sp.]|uniref:class I SAM-dependent methyltransferase n=1 Tax=Ferrovibrio sp. TaxID=1917215 RepID=UPI002ED40059